MRKTLLLAVAMVLIVTSGNSQSQNDPLSATGRTVRTENLLTSLKRMAAEGKFMFGHHDDTVYGLGWNGDADRSDVRSVCGDWPAVISFDLGRLERDNEVRNLDGVPVERMRQEIIRHYQRGGIVSLSWHCYNPLSGRHAWVEDNSRELEKQTVAAILAEGGAVNKTFMTWLDHVADFLNSLQTPDGIRVPVIFRPWHEHTGSWFWWGQNLCTTPQFKALWHLTVNRLKERGVVNALYAYSTGLEANGDPKKFMERYPGDEYIDLLGMDCYCSTSEPEAEACRHYIDKVARNVPMLCQLAKEHGKACAITETGYEGIKTADWWTKTLLPAVTPFQLSYVLVWRNAHDKKGHFYAPYPGQLSAADFMKFYKDKRTLFAGDLKGVY